VGLKFCCFRGYNGFRENYSTKIFQRPRAHARTGPAGLAQR